jgi:tryptophan synthase alpha subunit
MNSSKGVIFTTTIIQIIQNNVTKQEMKKLLKLLKVGV